VAEQVVSPSPSLQGGRQRVCAHNSQAPCKPFRLVPFAGGVGVYVKQMQVNVFVAKELIRFMACETKCQMPARDNAEFAVNACTCMDLLGVRLLQGI
jgi:hypothetical protein